MKVGHHVSFVCSRSKTLFYRLSHVAKANWGIGNKKLITIYKGRFIPIVSYVAAGWVHKLNSHHTRKLIAAQRQVLIHVCKAYRTVSADALMVIAGVPPLDLLLSERVATYSLKKNKKISHGSLLLDGPDSLERDEINKLNARIKRETNIMWQIKWDTSPKTRLTYRYVPDIGRKINASWLLLNHYVVQMLTGHGDFNQKLYNFNLIKSPSCLRGADETAEHIIFTCPFHEESRKTLQEQIRKADKWPCKLETLLNKINFNSFAKFATDTLKNKQKFTNQI